VALAEVDTDEPAPTAPAPGGPLVVLGKKARRNLERVAARHSAQYRLVVRARIVLSAGDGSTVAQVAAKHGVSPRTVRRRLDRYRRHGVRGLFDAPRPGRPEVHGPSARLLVISTATSASTHRRPRHAGHIA
jgi:DNA-directed RNA polymerase specialized sigma24 family protein